MVQLFSLLVVLSGLVAALVMGSGSRSDSLEQAKLRQELVGLAQSAHATAVSAEGEYGRPEGAASLLNADPFDLSRHSSTAETGFPLPNSAALEVKGAWSRCLETGAYRPGMWAVVMSCSHPSLGTTGCSTAPADARFLAVGVTPEACTGVSAIPQTTRETAVSGAMALMPSRVPAAKELGGQAAWPVYATTGAPRIVGFALYLGAPN